MNNQAIKNFMHAEQEEKEKSHEGITANMELISRVAQLEDYQARLVLSFVNALWPE